MGEFNPIPAGRRAVVRWRAFLHRHWLALLRLRGRVQLSQEAVHLALAGAVGVLGALVNLAFHHSTELLKQLWLGGTGEWTFLAAQLEPWQRLALPLAGGLGAGWLLHWAFRIARFPDSGNLLEVVVVGDGRLHFRSALARSVASLLSITSGGSIGREGALTHLSATLASKCGQWAHWPPYRLRLLVACGAAAGIAAAYNAPVAGAVFAAQVILGTFSMTLFAPLVCASVVATMLSRTFFGIEPWFHVPGTFEFDRVSQLPWFLVLGTGCGLLGATFLAALRRASALFQRLKGPIYVRLGLGGALVGLIAIVFPEVWGNGYGQANRILNHSYLLPGLVLVVSAKLLATLITVGSGAVGGVMTPTLFLGAGCGAGFGLILHHYQLAEGMPDAAFALVGMGSFLAATTHLPLLALILVFEISLNHTLIPPLMLGCAVATLVSRGCHRDDIYTEPLRRRGIELDRERIEPGSATQQTVGDLMVAPVEPLAATAQFRQIADRFLTSANNHLPVVDAQGRLLGLVALQDLKSYLNAGSELDSVIAYDVMRPAPPCLTPDQSIADALPLLLASELRNVPVVNTLAERRLIGSVARGDALGRLAEAIELKSTAPL